MHYFPGMTPMKRVLIPSLAIATSCSSGGILVAPNAVSAAGPGIDPADSAYMNSIGMEFVLIPSGSFYMGTDESSCPQDDPSTARNERVDCLSSWGSWVQVEKPRHEVTLGKPFYLSRYEVTQEQWFAVMGTNPALFKDEKVGETARNYPVENISWDDAKAFVQGLNAKEGSGLYRLPSEAEWEYAARAGQGQAYEYAGGASVETVAWYIGNSSDQTHRVGTKAPNAWGLYDMSGNVFEWVEDCWHYSYTGAPTDGSAWPCQAAPLARVLRGGSWRFDAVNVRIASRSGSPPGSRNGLQGFRVALPVP